MKIEELKQLVADAQAAIDGFKKNASLLARHNPRAYSEQLQALQQAFVSANAELLQAQADQRWQDIKNEIHQQSAANRAKLAEERAAQLEQDKIDKAAALRQQALNTWLEGGGSVEGFDRNWPDIQTELLKQATIAAITAPPAPDAFTRWKQRQNGRVVVQ